MALSLRLKRAMTVTTILLLAMLLLAKFCLVGCARTVSQWARAFADVCCGSLSLIYLIFLIFTLIRFTYFFVFFFLLLAYFILLRILIFLLIRFTYFLRLLFLTFSCVW
jgi:hypothetical protein